MFCWLRNKLFGTEFVRVGTTSYDWDDTIHIKKVHYSSVGCYICLGGKLINIPINDYLGDGIRIVWLYRNERKLRIINR